MNSKFEIAIVTGSSNPSLSKLIGSRLDLAVQTDEVGQFADGETRIKLEADMRGRDVYVVQPTCNPVNHSYMELFLLIHTLKLASAGRITAVLPYFGYARQDRKTESRTPISASAVAQLMEAMKPDRIITVDLHCGQIQGFFHGVPVDHLSAQNEFVSWLRHRFQDDNLSNCVIVSPDAGGVARAKEIADKLEIQRMATIMKRRAGAGVIESMELVGDVKGLDCIIIDDIIDTAGTLCKAAENLLKHGARSVGACATHGVFSGPAMSRIRASQLSFVCVTDSIPQQENQAKCPEKLSVISLAPLLAEAIHRVHNDESLSALFRMMQIPNHNNTKNGCDEAELWAKYRENRKPIV
jgi:ribose-phosphate pyrophosphokinase